MKRHEVDELEQLRPVMGRKVDALQTAWLSAPPSERAEIEIAAEFMKRKIAGKRVSLLSPPSGDQADGPIRLGRVLHGHRELGSLGLTRKEITQHLAVTGRSGCGKSTLSLQILLQLCRERVPWLIFDYKRSARALQGMDLEHDIHVSTLGRDIGATMSFNPLVPPPGVPMDSHIRTTVELIARSWFAGDGVMSLLERGIREAIERTAPEPPTLADVKAVLDERQFKGREAQWSQSCDRILQQMTTGQLGKIFCRRRDASSLHQLRWNFTILELDGLSTTDAAFITQHIMHFITHQLLDDTERETLRFVAMIEEAHHLLGKHDGAHETILETCLREGREVGLGIIIADQCVSAISPTALANCFTVVCMNVRQKADVQAGAASLLLDESSRAMLSTLPVGQAVVRMSDRWPHPVHIQVPPLDLPKGSVSDRDVHHAFLGSPYVIDDRQTVRADSGTSAESVDEHRESEARPPIPPPDKDTSGISAQPTTPYPEQSSEVRGVDETVLIEADCRLLLQSVAQQPLLGVAARYEALGLSRRRGNYCKNALVGSGFLTPVEIPIATGKTVLLEMTDPARRWLSRRQIPITAMQGSMIHAYWQQSVCEMLSDLGWQAMPETVVAGHAFDVCATHGTTTAILEVETGKSNWLLNLSHLEKADADHRAVIWLDAASYLRAKEVLPSSVTLLQPRQVARWLREISPRPITESDAA